MKMKIIEKIKLKQEDLLNSEPITIGFLGDSVTQGCFECYLTSQTTLETVYDGASSFSNRLKELFAILYPRVQINFINAGVSGDSATSGLKRIDRDVLKYNPDLVVVGFALNDSCAGINGLETYKKAMSDIVDKIKNSGAECILLTPNSMNLNVSPHLKDSLFIDLAKSFSSIQNDGVLDLYVNVIRKVAEVKGAKLCDMYSKWKKMISSGVNVTELLANKLNHPIREIHYLTAIMLLDCILED